jgi:hypothetical protein
MGMPYRADNASPGGISSKLARAWVVFVQRLAWRALVG